MVAAAQAAASHRDACIFVPFCSQALISQVVIAGCWHRLRFVGKKRKRSYFDPPWFKKQKTLTKEVSNLGEYV